MSGVQDIHVYLTKQNISLQCLVGSNIKETRTSPPKLLPKTGIKQG